MTIEIAVLDMAGTTVADDGAVLAAFTQAAHAMGIAPGSEREEAVVDYAKRTMGESKIVVFAALFGHQAAQANAEFEAAYDRMLPDVVAPIAGAEAAIGELRERGIKVALTTGFSPATRDAILARLGWGDLADLALSPADAGRGRPYPDLALTALMRLGGSDVRCLATAGDTTSDMASGRRAGASCVIGVETGTHSRAELEGAGATAVLPSVAELPAYLSRNPVPALESRPSTPSHAEGARALIAQTP